MCSLLEISQTGLAFKYSLRILTGKTQLKSQFKFIYSTKSKYDVSLY